MTPKDAHGIMVKVVEQALASGMFKELKSLNIVQEALVEIENAIKQVPAMREDLLTGKCKVNLPVPGEVKPF